MVIKRIAVCFMVVSLSLAVFGSCKKISVRGGSLKSGNGKTPLQAIVIVPTMELQKSQALTITVNDNVRWFVTMLKSGQSYQFETNGKGDPALEVYKSSQIKGNERHGEAFERDDDSAKDGKNAKHVFTPPASGKYYIRILLYAGSKWNGNLLYKIQ
ncbi:MAG TPA: PPC domain-containing protein [Spirochaetota bacterium]|nr:PPC domain-containing protein [Spirochaetota bacterium]HPJ34603.1 PPC domain-containing protein [Spirochaetota bacterium]